MLKPKQVDKLKYVAKGLQAVKAVSNALGTSPTATPEVDTKISKDYNGDGSTGDNSGDRKYEVDAEGKGYFVDEKSTPKFKDKNRKKAY